MPMKKRHHCSNASHAERLNRRALLKRGITIGGGFLSLLGPNGLSALADPQTRIPSMRDVNRCVRPLSCDTMVALPDATTTGTTVLGKNSDRPVFDCQPLVHIPRQEHALDATIKLEYRTIPQVEQTYATIGSSPYWCWGYEEGMNEFGVAIGNEAIFTKTFADASVFDALAEGQQKAFRATDVVISGAVLGGGADGLHKIVKRFLDFVEGDKGP